MEIFDKIIQFLFNCLFFLVPLFFLFNTSELFEFNKMLLIYSFASLIGFFWILKMILAKKIIIKKTFLDFFLIFFLFSQIISTVFSIDPHTSFFGYYGRFNGGLLSIFSYVFLYYAFVSNNVNPFSLVKMSLLSSFLVIVYAIPGKLGHDITCILASKGKILDNSCWDNSVLQFKPDVRVFSTFGQPNWFGAYLAIIFFLGLYYFINYQNSNFKKSYRKIFITLYLFLNFSFILFTRSRSALLAVLLTTFLFFVFYLMFFKKNFKKIMFILLIIFIIPIFLFKTGVNKIDRFLEISNLVFFKNKSSLVYNNQNINQNKFNITDSADIRKIVWKGALNLGFMYPFFGTGVETFAYSYNFVRPIEHNYTSEWDFVYNKAHNEYLNYFATTGFFGFFAYIFLIISVLFYFYKKIVFYQKSKEKFLSLKEEFKKDNKNDDFLFLTIILFSYFTILITNFFGFSTVVINLYFYLLPGFIIFLEKNKDKNLELGFENKSLIENFSFFQFLSILISFLFLIYLLFSIYRYYKADTFYSRADSYLKLKNPNQELAGFYLEKALKLRREHVYEDKFSSVLAYFSVLASLQKQTTLSANFIRLSNYYNDKSLASSPKNVFYLKTKAKNNYYYYLATDNPEYLHKSILVLNEAKKLAPTDPRISYNLALFYEELEKNEKDKGKKEYFKKKKNEELNNALFLKKDYEEAKNLLFLKNN